MIKLMIEIVKQRVFGSLTILFLKCAKITRSIMLNQKGAK